MYEPIAFVDQPSPLAGNPAAPRLNAVNLAHMQEQYGEAVADRGSYVSDTAPVTSLEKYIWLKPTGFGMVEFWIEDGT